MKLPYELFIGLRYLKAKRRQRSISLNTLISIGGVTLGVAALIATLAVMTGFKEDLRDKILGTNSHIVISDRTHDTLKDYRMVLERVKKNARVVAATPFIYNQVLLASEGTVYGVVLRGIDPALEGTVTDIEKNIVQGSLSVLESPPSEPGSEALPQPGILIGKELAGRLATFLGDTINVISPAGKPGPLGIIPKIRRFTVVGIFDSGMYEYDSTLAYISIAAAQDFFGLGDEVTGVEVKVDDIFIAGKVAEVIEEELGFPYWARDWMTLNRNLFSALQLEKIMMFIILVLIILVASFNIVGTLTMIVVEKSREIAILKAMGAKRLAVMRIFMIDGIIIGLVGTVIGIPLGYGVCELLQNFYTLPSDIYYISHLPVKIRLMDVILVSVSAVTISFLATLYPSYQAAQLNPAEALRYE
ncbi:MAG TPA: lipoprotein-releasing ABC transporter permease subunit [Nitrospiria bacterium]|nr:lipoprotein-releasing ABC transporter permease subunit [Nitrospiria bacterium]